MVYELLDKEGLYLGASSALNVVAAVELAQKLGRGVEAGRLCFNLMLMRLNRIHRSHNIVRWGISVSKSAFLKEVVASEGPG